MSGLFIGLNTIDFQFAVDEYPKQNTKIKASKNGVYVGGPAANASIIFSKLGGNSTFLSAIGNHYMTYFINNELKSYGVHIIDMDATQATEPTMASIITNHLNGDRTIFSYNPQPLPAQIIFPETLFNQKFKIILTDGFHADLALHYLSAKRAHAVPVILDGGSWKENTEQLLPYIKIAICSDHFLPPGITEKSDLATYLKSFGIQKVVITRGEHSILVWEGNTHYSIPVMPVKAVDTLGAGDFFHGAFCYYYSHKYPFREALKMASIIAGQSCKSFGTRKWLNEI